MRTKKRKFKKLFQEPQQDKPFGKSLLIFFAFIVLSIICLLIAHFDFNRFYWLFIAGLLGFSFTTAYLMVNTLELFLPSTLINHRLWTGENIGGRGLASLIAGVLAIAIMLGLTYLMEKMDVGYLV